MNAPSYHEPVLVEEVLSVWVTDPEARYLDGTVGGGGHAEALLSRYPGTSLVGFDQDPEAIEAATLRLDSFGDRATLVRSDFASMESALAGIPGKPVCGVLLDLGVSSRQLDAPERGFSYSNEGPLRLVLDRDAPTDARDFLESVTEDELRGIFQNLADLPRAGRAARAVLREMHAGRISTTTDLANVLRGAGQGSPRRLSQAFQALRMAVNDELGSLRKGMAAAARILPLNGVLAVISFESVTDREVKRTFRPPREGRPMPGEVDPDPIWEVVTRGAVRPGEDEIRRNPRARSARLRAARRTAHAAA